MTNRQPSRTNTPAPQRHPEAANFPAMLSKYRDQIAPRVPRHVDLDRAMAMAVACYRATPKLAQAEPSSVLACVLQAVQCGLELGTVSGEAHLVPRWNDREGRYVASMQVGYRGFVKLARQGGLVADIAARVVHARDHFEILLGSEERLAHRPHLGGDRGEPVAVYAVATVDGRRQIEVMTWAEVLEIRDKFAPRDRGGNVVGPWRDFIGPMAIKTVIRRAAKLWPQSVELQIALATDGRDMGHADAERVFTGRIIEMEDGAALELPQADDAAALLLQQVADADSTEALDSIASAIEFRALPAKDARRVRDALTARAAALAGGRQ